MTSCFHIMGRTDRGLESATYSKLFTVTRQVAPLTEIDRKPVEANSALRIRAEVCYRRLPCCCRRQIPKADVTAMLLAV